MYVIESGERTGCFLVYIKEENIFESLAFLCMPFPMEFLYLEKKEVKEFLKTKQMRFVSILPQNIYDVCRANFVWGKKNGK